MAPRPDQEQACSVSKSTPVWKCKWPSMFNLSRFAASKCVPIKGQPRNIRIGKKKPDGVILVVNLIKQVVTRSGIVQTLGVKEASTSKTRHLSCNAVFKILLCLGKDLTLIGKHRAPSVVVLIGPKISLQLCKITVQDARLQNNCLELGRMRDHLSFKIRFLLIGFHPLVIAVRLAAGLQSSRVHGGSGASQQRSATVDDRLLRLRHGGAPKVMTFSKMSRRSDC